MKIQKWVILLIALAMMAGAAGTLNQLKGRQKLGQPGIKATPIPGSVVVNIDLPERVLDFSSTNVPEPQVVLDYLPKDTSYAQRHYQAPDGFDVSATVILMGMDRTSIHRPDFCLPGQGWRIDEQSKVNIPLAGMSHELPVMKWVLSNQFQTPDGQKTEVHGLFVFWFIADHQQTTEMVQLQSSIIKNLLFNGVLQRWAYVSYFAVCLPGEETAAFERVKKLIAASAPEYLVLPGGKTTVPAGR
jgi:hypothetical protein